MTNEDLELIKSKYSDLVKTRDELVNIQKSIMEYEKDPAVIKYLSLKEELKDKKFYFFSNRYNSNDVLFELAIDHVRINNPCNIYTYMGTYKHSNESDIVHGIRDHRVIGNDSTANYRLYRNIELLSYQMEYELQIPIESCDLFESQNIVFYPYGEGCELFYNKVRKAYFDTAINTNCETAKEKVLSKYKRRV